MDGPGVQDRQGGEMGGVIASRGYGIQLLETLRRSLCIRFCQQILNSSFTQHNQ